MFHSWSCQVVGFCSCSGLNGLVVVRWNPTAPAAISSGGSAGISRMPCRAKRSRNSASTTPLSAKPTMTMEITQ